MTPQTPGLQLLADNNGQTTLVFSGDWTQGLAHPEFNEFRDALGGPEITSVVADGGALSNWDSIFMAFLLQCYNTCEANSAKLTTLNMPAGVERLLQVATAVPTHEPATKATPSLLEALNPAKLFKVLAADTRESLAFIGEISLALKQLLLGKANTRLVDFRNFCYQAGPDALAIISLTSVLVGMILAYLGAVQLQQFGAEVYVADLVVIGMLREMGVLMTAVVMAGRTGAAYAAQLGTMQTNEEIDAIVTMGVSPMEFLVVPRVLALVVIMPLLTIYADLLGIVGGAIVAGGMGIAPLQYLNQAETAMTLSHAGVGLFKSLVFAILIGVAGCRAGINSGRSSAAVGQAATEAVVTAIVYLIIADAAINIIFQQLEI